MLRVGSMAVGSGLRAVFPQSSHIAFGTQPDERGAVHCGPFGLSCGGPEKTDEPGCLLRGTAVRDCGLRPRLASASVAGSASGLSGAAERPAGPVLRRRVVARHFALVSVEAGAPDNTTDLNLLYYVDYAGYWRATVSWHDLPAMIWSHIDQTLTCFGGMLWSPTSGGGWWWRNFQIVVAVFALVGTVRMARRSGELLYPFYGLGMTAMLMIWNAPVEGRLVYTVLPLLAAGLVTELSRVGTVLLAAFHKPGLGEKVVAAAFAALLVLAVIGTGRNLATWQGRLDDVFAEGKTRQAELNETASWLRLNTKPGDIVVSDVDRYIYLRTGLRGISQRYPYDMEILGRHADIPRYLSGVASYAAQLNARYLVRTGRLEFGLSPEEARRFYQLLAESPHLRPVWKTDHQAAYAVTQEIAAGLASSPQK